MSESHPSQETPTWSSFPLAPPPVEPLALPEQYQPYPPAQLYPPVQLYPPPMQQPVGYMAPVGDAFGGPLPTSGLAITSLVCSLCAIVFWPALIAGLICGHLALREIDRGKAAGRGFALAGLITGYILLGMTVLSFVAFFGIFFLFLIAPNAH